MTHKPMIIRGIHLAILILALAVPVTVSGETPARKNREGNRLFTEGKFADAEKAYVDALVQAPGRAELLYNHGNALIRQKKHDSALQQLSQAAGKGHRGIQANAWFNSGNALYETSRFGDAAQAYIQALRINPADRDAKHNLELALQKEREKQDRSAQGKQQEDKKEADRQPSGKQQDGEQQANPQKDAGRQEEKRDQAADPQSGQPDKRDGSISREQALQILDALQNQELGEQKKRLERMARKKAVGKDW